MAQSNEHVNPSAYTVMVPFGVVYFETPPSYYKDLPTEENDGTK